MYVRNDYKEGTVLINRHSKVSDISASSARRYRALGLDEGSNESHGERSGWTAEGLLSLCE